VRIENEELKRDCFAALAMTENRRQRTEDRRRKNVQCRIANFQCKSKDGKKRGEKMTSIQIKIPIVLDLCFAWPVLLYRLARYGYPYRKIPLGEGRFAIVDPLIFYSLNKFHWTIEGREDCIYAVRNVVTNSRHSKTVRKHREIMKAEPGVLIDHRNVNPLDNRIANLRPATLAQNMHNRRKIRRKTSSRFIGPCLEKESNLFRVNLMHEGKRIYVGRFANEIDAARAYDRAALKHHGELARLNFPREDYIDEIKPS